MRRNILIALALLFVIAVPVAAKSLSESDVQAIVKKFLMENPKVMVDALEKYQSDMAKAQVDGAKKALADNADWLFKGNHPETGAKDGTALVEFLDYNCGYCKKSHVEVKQLLEKDKNLRVIYVDIPILGTSSIDAAKWALAAAKQGKYNEFHNALMEHKGPKDDAVLTTLAQSVGLNVDQLKKDKDSADIQKTLDDNIAKAGALGINGTPAFITTAELIGGYVDAATLATAIETARRKK